MKTLIEFATTIPTKVGDKKNNLTKDITGILNAIIAALGIVCVVVMLVGGINYMTSAGDTSKVEKAKKTILYGFIGLIICVLSFALVNWVISSVLIPADASTYTTKEDCVKAGYKWNKIDENNGECVPK